MLYSYNYSNNHLLHYRKASYSVQNNFSVVEIGFNRVPPKLRQIMTRNVFIIHYVTKGSGVFMGNKFSAGDCYFVVPGEFEIFEALEDEPYECAWITINGRRAKEMISMAGLPEHNSIFKFEYTEQCAEIIKEYLFHDGYENDYVEASKLEETFYKILSYHFKSCRPPELKANNKAAEIAEFIEKNYGRGIKISDLCNVFYLSKNYLCTIFKREYGITPQEYLISYRIEKAKQLLKLDDKKLSVAEISFSVGIDNPLYFSRCFHQRVGLSPSEYRKKK